MCILFANEQERLLADVRRRTGVGGQLMCTFSHTHSAPPCKLDQAAPARWRADRALPRPARGRGRGRGDRGASGGAAGVDRVRAGRQRRWPATGTCGTPKAGSTSAGSTPTARSIRPSSSARVTGADGRAAGDPGQLRLPPDDARLAELADQSRLSRAPCGRSWKRRPGRRASSCRERRATPARATASSATPPVADRNGRQLGYAALSALASMPAPATSFRYQGPSISGTTLGLWEHVPFSDEERAAAGSLAPSPLDRPARLPRRTCRPSTRPSLDREQWTAEEAIARAAGDEKRAADCRGKAEQAYRLIDKLSLLPPGPDYPLAIVLIQTGDAFWLAVEAEHYNVLQRELRERFPDVALVVITLMDGGRVAYLPTADTYGKGLYQETIAVLAPGIPGAADRGGLDAALPPGPPPSRSGRSHDRRQRPPPLDDAADGAAARDQRGGTSSRDRRGRQRGQAGRCAEGPRDPRSEGRFPDRGRPRPRRRPRDLRRLRGRDARGGRRVGLGQERHLAGGDGTASTDDGQGVGCRDDERPESARAVDQRPPADPRQRHRDDLPGPEHVAQPGHVRRGPDRRDDPGARPGNDTATRPVPGRSGCWTSSASRTRRSAAASIRTSSRAGCASGR